jgi:hypothetical protein
LHYSTLMERYLICAGLTAFLAADVVRAQTPLDVIKQDLAQAQQQHAAANSQEMTTFLSSLEQAIQSPASALDLYQRAGGNLPDAAPVRTRYDYETPTERARREAIDAQNYKSVAALIQIHCGLMRNAALIAANPKKPDVLAEWHEWLKTAAVTYPQFVGNALLKQTPVKDSVISGYLGFQGWGNSASGSWSVSQIPALYRAEVLGPLREAPSQATLDAWDTYIAMRQADQPNRGKWAQEDQPALAFDRGSDDFAIKPTMDKLAALDEIIKANPASSHLDEWAARMQGMIAAYQAGGAYHINQLPQATPSTPSSEVGGGALPAATPGTSSSEVAGTMPTGASYATPVTSGGAGPAATPGTPSSEVGGATPTATPGAPSVIPEAQFSGPTPGTPSSEAGGATPTATPGTPSSGGGSPTPTASPGSPSSGGGSPTPTATPGTPSSGGGSPTPTATPGTP